jgi:hypothetical protein
MDRIESSGALEWTFVPGLGARTVPRARSYFQFCHFSRVLRALSILSPATCKAPIDGAPDRNITKPRPHNELGPQLSSLLWGGDKIGNTLETAIAIPFWAVGAR